MYENICLVCKLFTEQLKEHYGDKNIVYPKAFSGKSGENVFKFVKDFQDAIAANQVRDVDKVKKLMLLLKDDAKRAVGEHYKEVQEALDELKRSYGNEEIIWDKVKAS